MGFFNDVGNFFENTANGVGRFLFEPEDERKSREEWEHKQWEINTFHPVLFPHIRDYYWNRVQLIRLDRTNQHRNRVAFQDAVGYDTNPTNHLTVLNLYVDQIPNTGWTFLPNWDDEYYFKHPFRWDTYIALSSYFDYLKKARISELERIAYDLGAKHIKICFKEEKKENWERDTSVEILRSGVEVGKNQSDSEYFELALDTNLDGNDYPVEPELLFFKDDADVNTLIHMRMDPNNKLKKKVYNLGCGGSHCMSVDVAVYLGETCGFSYKNRVETENRTILEYTLEF